MICTTICCAKCNRKIYELKRPLRGGETIEAANLEVLDKRLPAPTRGDQPKCPECGSAYFNSVCLLAGKQLVKVPLG